MWALSFVHPILLWRLPLVNDASTRNIYITRLNLIGRPLCPKLLQCHSHVLLKLLICDKIVGLSVSACWSLLMFFLFSLSIHSERYYQVSLFSEN